MYDVQEVDISTVDYEESDDSGWIVGSPRPGIFPSLATRPHSTRKAICCNPDLQTPSRDAVPSLWDVGNSGARSGTVPLKPRPGLSGVTHRTLSQFFFRPFWGSTQVVAYYPPRLAPWTAFFARFAAEGGHASLRSAGRRNASAPTRGVGHPAH